MYGANLSGADLLNRRIGGLEIRHKLASSSVTQYPAPATNNPTTLGKHPQGKMLLFARQFLGASGRLLFHQAK
ncbi:Uncharacterised protein [Budvicia aquatica]|uniref:Uncharacterized protein n=1 Tax=Budvicia aquatica TaxID=82979 RepID=A0A484ZN56_9GAMM|nr:Uncharacterised protein [Budvicia aquatica]